MKHSITFTNADNKWDNALPLGNGCFGAMVYYEKNRLYMPMNHYEIYYNISDKVLPKDKLEGYVPEKNPGAVHQEYIDRANRNQPVGKETFTNYMLDKASAFDETQYSAFGFSGSYPPTGNLEYNFCDCLKDAEQSLVLYVEDAKCELTLSDGDKKITVDAIVARDDCAVNHIKQSKQGLIKSFELAFPPSRDIDYPDISYIQIDSKTFACTVKRALDKEQTAEPFVFSDVIRLVGAEGKLVVNEFDAEIVLENAENDFYILTGIFTDWNYKNPLEDGIKKIDEFEENLASIYEEHHKYWNDFFERSKISIPDKFLENVYYVNQYALDCCSGKGGIMKHHACGLNGLWDVRHPNLWGSMWYWDVNIQAAFAGVFSSNRLDLAKVFSDGLLSYVELAKNFAKDVHNVNGIAGDYPYTFYYACWPWCAQYLWFLYEYSLDKEYLKNDAFPVFVKLSEFFLNIFKYDEERGYYSVYPDISPEQGPLAHDTVITVSCVKYLFKFTLEAAEILGVDLPILDSCRKVMNNMAPYPISEDGMYGKHFKDSEDAPDNMWIRHPSMLMPLFPIGEFDLNSDKEIIDILSNTVDFLDERAEIGIFGGSWIAASAARLGRGQAALRLLYERGIDHMLRSNGLTAEETDRFMNFCLILRQPIYYPCMMEFTGEMLAALNEMLIQSHNNLIRVFPAIPDGDPEYERLHRHGYPLSDWLNRCAKYDAWKDVRFDKLLAKGAFEVTAEMKDSKLKFIEIYSKKGGKVNITSPYINSSFNVFCDGADITYDISDEILSFQTEEGKTYIIAETKDVNTLFDEPYEYSNKVLSKMTYTKRYIYLGENAEAKYQKAVDYFVRDWYLGNSRMSNHLMYKFDITSVTDKDYSKCLFRQFYGDEERLIGTMAFNTFENDKLQFTIKQGYGFDDASKVSIINRKSPDLLRQDFAEGSEAVEFIIDAPRGQYELFVVSGDSEEESVTIVEAVNGRKAGGEIIKSGEYQCKVLPLFNENDEPIRLKISTKPDCKWKVNYIMLNAIKGY